MKYTKLYTCLIAAAAVAAPMTAQAAYNIYSKDGLTVDFGGNVTAQFSKKHNKFTYKHDSARYYYNYDISDWESAQAGHDVENSDRRARLGFDRDLLGCRFAASSVSTKMCVLPPPCSWVTTKTI